MEHRPSPERSRAWAREHGVVMRTGEELLAGNDFRHDMCIDFGRLQRLVPAFALRPRTIDELAACMRYLADEEIPYKLRGCAHSPGGEVLSDGGAVIDIRDLTGIVADDPDAEEVTVRGGSTWLELWEHLAPTARRPLALTTNPRVTMAGSLVVGGIGDATHLNGPQVAAVRRGVIVTPDGVRHDVKAGDPLLDHALCGHGQLGALAEVTLATWRRPSIMCGSVLEWMSLEWFLIDAEAVFEGGLYDYFHPRLRWRMGHRVSAIAGTFRTTLLDRDPALTHLTPIATSRLELLDLLEHTREDPYEKWAYFGPCAELIFPYPDTLDTFRRVDEAILTTGLWRNLPQGCAVMLFPGTPQLPLAPFQAPRCLILAVRPQPAELADARKCQDLLIEIADMAIAGGARLYLSSFPLHGAALERQLGEGARSLERLKNEVDPRALCNRGNLFGWAPAAPAPA